MYSLGCMCVCVCVPVYPATQCREEGEGKRGHAGPSEHSLAKCQARSDHKSTEMSLRPGSKEANTTQVNARQIFIITSTSGQNNTNLLNY